MFYIIDKAQAKDAGKGKIFSKMLTASLFRRAFHSYANLITELKPLKIGSLSLSVGVLQYNDLFF